MITLGRVGAVVGPLALLCYEKTEGKVDKNLFCGGVKHSVTIIKFIY